MGWTTSVGGGGESVQSVIWVNRPDASSVPIGTRIRVIDLRHQDFWSDGSYWRPCGVVILCSIGGIISNPAAIIAGSPASFAIPGNANKLPAGILSPNSRLTVNAEILKSGSNSTGYFCRIGTSNSNADSLILNGSYTSNNLAWLVSATMLAGNSQNELALRNTDFTVSSEPLTGGITTLSANINTGLDMYVSLGASSINAADSIALIGLTITLEG